MGFLQAYFQRGGLTGFTRLSRGTQVYPFSLALQEPLAPVELLGRDEVSFPACGTTHQTPWKDQHGAKMQLQPVTCPVRAQNGTASETFPGFQKVFRYLKSPFLFFSSTGFELRPCVDQEGTLPHEPHPQPFLL
jgi:hypothetical protein